MEDNELKNLWQAYDEKLQKTLDLNQKILDALQTDRVESKLDAFRRSHTIILGAGIVWILFLLFLWVNTLHNLYFTVSVGAIIGFNVYAVVAYARHLSMLSAIRVSDSITETQDRLARLQIDLSDVGRILFLQAPFYCTFWYTDELVANAGPVFWGIQALIVGTFTTLAVFLYKNVNYRNLHKNWVRKFMDSFGGSKLRQATEFLHEIESFKKG